MFQAPGLGAGGAWQQAWGSLAACLWAVRLRRVCRPSPRPSKARFCTAFATHSWVRGRVPSSGTGTEGIPHPLPAEVAVPVAEPPSRTGLSCACPRGLQQQNPQPGGSKRRKCHASRVCRLGVRGRAAAGPCARWAPFLPLPALAVAGRPGGPWTVPAHLPGTPGVSARGPPCSDVTSPYPITSAVSRPRSQVLGVRASTCLLLRGTEFNP